MKLIFTTGKELIGSMTNDNVNNPQLLPTHFNV